MTRPAVTVRRVNAELERQLTDLWVAARVEHGTSPEVAARAVAEGRVHTALSRDDVRAFLALADDGAAVGFAVATHSSFTGLAEAASVVVDQVYVRPASRRHGVARHLLAAVASYADSLGCEQLGCNVPAHMRDANRFFARLGFSSQLVRRVTTTGALRRRLSIDEPRHALDVILHKRRSLRARAGSAART